MVRENKGRYRSLLAAQLLGLLDQGKQHDAQSVWEEHRQAFLTDDSYLRLLVAHTLYQRKPTKNEVPPNRQASAH